MNIFMRSSRAP